MKSNSAYSAKESAIASTKGHLSDKRKLILINQAIQGLPISRICREQGISRTIFYRWIKQYNESCVTGDGDATGYPSGFRRIKKKDCPRTIDIHVERRVVHYAIRKPRLTIRQYAARAGISVRAVWLILKSQGLSSRSEREQYVISHGSRIYHSPTHLTKISLLKRAQQGEQISNLCQEAGISRTIFYRWLSQYKAAGNKYDSLQSQRPYGARHYRYIKGLDTAILRLVRDHPEYSLSRYLTNIPAEEIQTVSRSGVYKVLKRLGLTTMQARLAYAKLALKTDIPEPTAEEMLPAIPDYLFISFLSPPVRDQFLHLHILFFEELHQHLQSPDNCYLCSQLQQPDDHFVLQNDEGVTGDG